jgi:tRNA threonylcarbamoyladenosine biosynthesis protein TsaE
MNSVLTYNTTTTDADATSRLGERLGAVLVAPMTLELISDLGGGKTTFVQGLARGLGYQGEVTSPTFTLSRIYELPGERELHHFDLYRLSGSDVVVDELADVTGQAGIIIAIEWPDTARQILPSDHLSLTFIATGDDERRLEFEAHGPNAAKALKEIMP